MPIPYEQSQLDELNAIIRDRCPENGYPDLKGHMLTWSIAKSPLYRLFGNQLKIEREVESSVSDSKMTRLIETFCLDICEPSIQFICVKMFLLNSTLSIAEIKENMLFKDITFLDTVFKKGMKISRILPKLVIREHSEYIQIEYSKVLQSVKVKGTAVLSIDPKDFITMSETNYDWRSCQALDGEFRTATLAYMMDEVTAVAYVTSGDIARERKYSFPNKFWRQLVYINSGDLPYAVQSRQYPSANLNSEQAISEILIRLFGGEYRAESVATETINDYHVVADDCDSDEPFMWYNDITKGAVQICTMVLPKDFNSVGDLCDHENYRKVIVGTDGIPCACGCGSHLEDAEYLFCDSKYENDYEENEDDE